MTILAIDQGTTSTRAVSVREDGALQVLHTVAHRQIYPRPGWVEHDAQEIWERTQSVVRAALQKAGCAPADK